MPAPVASGWSDRRVGLAPTGKAPPCHGARGNLSFGTLRKGKRENSPRRGLVMAAVGRLLPKPGSHSESWRERTRNTSRKPGNPLSLTTLENLRHFLTAKGIIFKG